MPIETRAAMTRLAKDEQKTRDMSWLVIFDSHEVFYNRTRQHNFLGTRFVSWQDRDMDQIYALNCHLLALKISLLVHIEKTGICPG